MDGHGALSDLALKRRSLLKCRDLAHHLSVHMAKQHSMMLTVRERSAVIGKALWDLTGDGDKIDPRILPPAEVTYLDFGTRRDRTRSGSAQVSTANLSVAPRRRGSASARNRTRSASSSTTTGVLDDEQSGRRGILSLRANALVFQPDTADGGLTTGAVPRSGGQVYIPWNQVHRIGRLAGGLKIITSKHPHCFRFTVPSSVGPSGYHTTHTTGQPNSVALQSANSIAGSDDNESELIRVWRQCCGLALKSAKEASQRTSLRGSRRNPLPHGASSAESKDGAPRSPRTVSTHSDSSHPAIKKQRELVIKTSLAMDAAVDHLRSVVLSLVRCHRVCMFVNASPSRD